MNYRNTHHFAMAGTWRSVRPTCGTIFHSHTGHETEGHPKKNEGSEFVTKHSTRMARK